MMRKKVMLTFVLFIVVSCLPVSTMAATQAPGQESTSVGLQLVAEGLTSPVTLLSSPDGTNRVFIVDQIGVIRILTPDGELLEEPFLDLRSKMVKLRDQFDERGLLGLVFHPDFGENGHFFVYYSAPLREQAHKEWNHTSHISEFRVSPYNKNKADPRFERILLQIDEPQFNHNGGQLAFGPDDSLYIGVGDGGGANDVGTGHPPVGNGQDTSTLTGSILRIDVDGGDPYRIPTDNPFVGRKGADEIFAYGLRNSYRFSFDLEGKHELFVADVGQNLWEEVNIVTRGGNYGWNIKEAAHCFDPDNPNESPAECPDMGLKGEPLIDPIIEYNHSIGISVIGGYVYRGRRLPEFYGRYIFGDWSTSFGKTDGKLFVATPVAAGKGLWPIEELFITTSKDGKLGRYLLGFGQDTQGELYVLTTERTGPTGNTGKIFKIVPPIQTKVRGKKTEVRVIEVIARSFEFEPSSIKIRKGETVRFVVKSQDIYHTFTVKKSKDTKDDIFNLNLFPGKPVEKEFTPQEVGIFYLYCKPHEGLGMTGSIEVTP
jgi:glucose/arabinose dehydrogenase/plastocyanin